jgi:TolA-binding protein
VSASDSPAPEKPHQVLDLHYGEVLYHFYQDDYFTAITHLMVARDQHLLPHHDQESDLLLAGLQLSYGMLDRAETRFHRLLDAAPDSALHDRVRYYLTRINYQRGHFREAHRTLQDLGRPRDPALAAELALLGANIEMKLGKNAAAAALLQTAHAPKGMEEYLTINRGIALLRDGKTEQGRQVLDKLGKQSAASEELRALRDRANLGLGYELLRAGAPAQAREYLNRVRLQGPFVQSALLGAGWSDAQRGDYSGALTPWMNLLLVGGHQPAVQEARLAVPYALAQLGDDRRAVAFYEQALRDYDDAQQQIDRAIGAVTDGTLVGMLSQADTGASGGWLLDNPTLQDVPSGRYLVDVLSGNNFQEALKDYRDLGYLSRLLNRWLTDMTLYDDMVEARQLAYEQRAPKIRERLSVRTAETLQERWRDYRDRLAVIRKQGNPIDLASSQEKRQWQRLEAIRSRLATLPDEPGYESLRARAEWLQGVLYWQLQADYTIRLWEVQKQLKALGPQLAETQDKHRRIDAALDGARTGFDGYNGRIDRLRERIRQLLPRIERARGQSGAHLQRLALEALDSRKQRLLSYRSQARYALARGYDRLEKTPGAQP